MIFPGALGDLICLGPALAAISRRQPRAAVELMARGELARFAEQRMGIARGHSIDRREVAACFSAGDAETAAARKFFGGFDRIYSFFAADDSRFRARLPAAAGGAVTFHQFRPPGSGHAAARYLQSIGESDAPLEARIEPTPGDLNLAARVLRGAGCEPARTVVIFPGSGSAAKNWPAENFVELARLMSRSIDVAIVLGPAEQALDALFRARGLPMLMDLDLGTVAGVARMSNGFVGNDSGVSHLAAAVGLPGVVIFGPTDPSIWRPLGPVAVLRRDPIGGLKAGAVAASLSRQLELVGQ